ncbi:MAG: Trp family transcriptional regulator [Candidatus Pacebacteria bacterium]|nr:Trp family transcriptional regulator [Candidatus Paceibacterota bacterium]
MRVRTKDLTKKQKDRIFTALETAAGTVKSSTGSKKLIEDLLTESEKIMIGRRILIARELIAGSTYDAIVDEYGVGKDTITRIAQWLEEQLPEHKKVTTEVRKDVMQKHGSKNKQDFDKELYATSALYRLKKKYPMHFLLFPMPKSKK